MSAIQQMILAGSDTAAFGTRWSSISAALRLGFPGGTPASNGIIYASMAYGTPGFFVSGNNGSTTKAATSPDGVIWTNQASVTTPLLFSHWGASTFIASEQAANKIQTSPDGATWTSRTITGFGDTGGLFNKTFASNGSRIVALGQEGRTAASLDSGVSWTTSSSLTGVGTWSFETLPRFVYFTGTKYLAFGTAGIVAQSSDGISWTAYTNLPAEFDSYIKVPTGLCRSSTGRILVISAGAVNLAAYSDNEGSSWTSCGTALSTALGGVAPTACTHTGQYFIAGTGPVMARSKDAITWEAITGGISSAFSGAAKISRNSMIWDGKNICAVGGEQTDGIYGARSE